MSEIQRLGGNVNAVIVQLPERKYPSVVMQRDSLQNLLSLVQETKQQILAGNIAETVALLSEAEQLIAGYVEAFELRS